ncbi:MAG: hypothetical protein HC886_15200 [Leptolyngbyaceae cyanobacterium SM1_1_3]|nr:hypothetical protein [Leptolyngbyaceae cyanobacterium SM1_1_3]NJO09298.1 hypothetical protein [Leptolyngbyaceae cyanobacterium SL_1_1]
MRARISNQVIYLHPEDVPQYNKQGSTVRNTYFWALRSIAARAYRGKDWEYEEQVWIALVRMLISFAESGYLGYRETTLEFSPDAEIPAPLRAVSTWGSVS